MKQKLLFIANPVLKKNNIHEIKGSIDKTINKDKFDHDFIVTARKGEGEEITVKNKDNYQAIIAVGGDGTVNEIARGLVKSNKALGIIPTGSGNGLARTLKIPINIIEAIKIINNFRTKKIDCGIINGHFFFNISGVGFDAEIAGLFNQTKSRGFFNYFQLTAKYFFRYKPKFYQININGKTLNKEAFLIALANSTQFGNNAHINPKGLLDDGKIECCLLKKFPLMSALPLAIRMFSKTLHQSGYFEYYQAEEIKISAQENMKGHIDGDVVLFGKELNVRIVKEGLQVIY